MISVLQWNCRSIVPKEDVFQHLVHSNQCDVFALCETWLELNSDFFFHDFNIVRQDREDSYGGVLLGVRECHSFFRIDLPSLTGIEIVAIEAQINGKSLCIASVYIPPGARVSRHQLNNILELLPEPRLVLGDFNSHGTGWGESYDDNRSTLIYDLCDDFSMTILNTGEITRIAQPPYRDSRLDLSICTSTLSLDCTWEVIQDPHGSDHLPILISIKNGNNHNEHVNVAYDLTRNIDWNRYEATIAEAVESVTVLSPREEYSFLESLIRSSALQAQTKRVPGSSVRVRPSSLWWDSECTEVYKDKSSAFKEFRRHGTVELYIKYAELETKLRNLIKGKKRGYWRRFVDGLSKDTSMSVLWSTARRMRNYVPTNESEQVSTSWVLKFAKKICPDSVPQRKLYRGSLTHECDSPFTMVELSIALLSCNNTAPGMDGIKFDLLKKLPDVAKERLLNLYNKLLEQNVVPDEWRQVKVIAIQKPGKPASDHNSYRPIAMISCIRKLLEKMILNRLDKWVEDNSLLSDTQFGFRRGKGTNDCLALLSSEIQQAFAQKKQIASVFLDIKGAYDSVSIEVLCDKLQQRGFSSVLNIFLYNLLSEKEMHFLQGHTAVSRTSYMGLLQGSSLSPLLYNFHVSDIDECLSEGCTLRQFADDGVISVVGSTAESLQRPLQDTLDNLTTWAVRLGIEFSTEKTEMVIFSRKHTPASFPLLLYGQTITHSNVFKYLGVWFDQKCTWRRQIVYLKQRCQQRINFLRTITGTWWGAHPEDLLRLYQTTILSVLEYGSFCFRSAAKTHLIKLERIQYRCLRIALGCMQSTHTKSLEVLAGVVPLQDRFAELSYRFLIRSEIRNPLVIENFEKLLEYNPQTRFMTIYYNFMTQEMTPSALTLPHGYFPGSYSSSVFFDLSMRHEIRQIPEQFRPFIVPQIFSNKFRWVSEEKMFYTDGSKIEESTGFGVFNINRSAFHKLKNPCSVYVAELAAIYYALCLIESQPPDLYFIVTDSLSAFEAIRSMKHVKHSSYFLLRIQENMSALARAKFRITLVWVPAHCSIPGNEQADSLAKVGALEGDVFERITTFNEYFSIFRQQTLDDWQISWDKGELGRWCHSIIPKVTKKPWFKGLDLARNFIRTISRLMSNHYTLGAHLYRIGLAEINVCSCGEGFHDIEHLVWSCSQLWAARSQLVDTLRARGRQPNVPVRDVLAIRDIPYLSAIVQFLGDAEIKI